MCQLRLYYKKAVFLLMKLKDKYFNGKILSELQVYGKSIIYLKPEVIWACICAKYGESVYIYAEYIYIKSHDTLTCVPGSWDPVSLFNHHPQSLPNAELSTNAAELSMVLQAAQVWPGSRSGWGKKKALWIYRHILVLLGLFYFLNTLEKWNICIYPVTWRALTDKGRDSSCTAKFQ